MDRGHAVGRRPLRTAAGALAAIALLAGCAGEPPAEPRDVSTIGQPSPEPSPEPSPSPEAIDISTVPDEITPAYVDAVVNELWSVFYEPYADVLATPVGEAPSPAAFERLSEVARGEYLALGLEELTEFATDASARDTLVPAAEFGQFRWTTVQVKVSEPSCIVAVGRIDRSEVTTLEVNPGLAYAIALGANDASPARAWVITDVLPNQGPDGPNPDSAMLDASLDDLSGVLSHECENGGQP